MDLPFELRREIFSLVLSCTYPVLQFQSDGSAAAPHGPVDVRLFAVSRQVFAEAVKIFYEVNTFSICTVPSSYRKAMPLFVRQGTESEAPRPIHSIKKIHVSFRLVTGVAADTDEFRFLWTIFSEFLKTCKNLREVKVSVLWIQNRWIDGAINLRADQLALTLALTLVDVGSTTGAEFSDTTTYEPCRPEWCAKPDFQLGVRQMTWRRNAERSAQ